MKILLCSAVFSPATRFGGLVTWAAQAAGELSARGHLVTVLATNVGARDAPVSETLPDGVSVERLPGSLTGGMLWSLQFVEAAARSVAGTDLVVVSGFWQWPVAGVCKAARAAGVPVVLVPHGGLAPWVWERHATIKRAFFKLRGAPAIRAASAVHFVSNREADSALGLDEGTQRLVSPPGVDLDFWKPDESTRGVARKGVGLEKGGAMFVWTGRFHEVKGLDLLPGAFAPLAGRNWKLVLVGHDNDSGAAVSLDRAFADAGLADKVVFVGGSDRESVRTLLRLADGFVLPSLHESFGFSAAEAAACGCAVAVSDACGIANVAAGEGFAVLPREAAVWTEWIGAVLDSVANAGGATGCRDRLEPVLSLRAGWDRTDALYREVAGRP